LTQDVSLLCFTIIMNLTRASMEGWTLKRWWWWWW